MADEARHREGGLGHAIFWIGGFSLVFLAARRSLVLLAVPGAAMGFALLVLSVAAATQLWRIVFDRLRFRFPPQRLLWMIPLFHLFSGYGAIFAVVGLPSWSSRYDFWKDLVGIPPTPFTRLVTTAFLVVGFSVAFLFARLVARFLADPGTAKLGTADAVTTLTCGLGLVIVPLLILWGRMALPQNVSYLRGWIALGMARRPQEALIQFGRIVEQFPESDLADSSLYRMARIEIEIVGRGADAQGRLERLIDRYPRSPLVDDALFDLGDLALRPPARPDRAEAYFRRLLEEYPGTYLKERAILGRAEALAGLGRMDEARALLEPLERGEGRVLTVIEDAEGEVTVRPTRDLAAAARVRLIAR